MTNIDEVSASREMHHDRRRWEQRRAAMPNLVQGTTGDDKGLADREQSPEFLADVEKVKVKMEQARSRKKPWVTQDNEGQTG